MKIPLSVLITGSSRPELLPYCIKSLQNMIVNCSTNIQYQFFYHEDSIYPQKSLKSMEIAKNNNCHVYQHSPAIGLGPSMTYMFNKCIKTSYMLYVQEDWEFERPIEMDRLLWIMEKQPRVNLILFNKRKNSSDVVLAEDEFLTQKMCLSPGWFFIPGLWRMSKALKHWVQVKEKPEGAFVNSFGAANQRKNLNFARNNIGAYYLGPFGEYRYVRHLGDCWRMAKWRRTKENKPGGSITEFASIPFDTRAPWLEEFPERPISPGAKIAKVDIKLLENCPIEVQNKLKKYL